MKGVEIEEPLKTTTIAGFAHQQDDSMIMQLPPEIRLIIYEYLFQSTRLVFNEQIASRRPTDRNLDSRSVVSLLRTCRRINSEIGTTWLGQVHLHFEDTVSFAYTLVPLSILTRSKIRHVSVWGGYLRWVGHDWNKEGDRWYIERLLFLLPGLALDTLTILGDEVSGVHFAMILFMITYSDGWKTLRFVAQASQVFRWDEVSASRQPEQTEWRERVEARDGSRSGASVTIQPIGAANRYRDLFPERRGKSGDTSKALLLDTIVVARRGSGANYVRAADRSCEQGRPLCRHNIGPTWKARSLEQAAREEGECVRLGLFHKHIYPEQKYAPVLMST